MHHKWTLIPLLGVLLHGTGSARQQEPLTRTLFMNTRIFDGRVDALSGPMNVLVEDGRITRIEDGPMPGSGALVLDVGGRTLMPGLIDGAVWLPPPPEVPGIDPAASAEEAEVAAQAAQAAVRDWQDRVRAMAREALEDGFTTWRVIDDGSLAVLRLAHAEPTVFPRVFASGRALSPLTGTREQAQERLDHGAAWLALDPALDPETVQRGEWRGGEAEAAAEDAGTFVSLRASQPGDPGHALAIGASCLDALRVADDAALARLAQNSMYCTPLLWLQADELDDHRPPWPDAAAPALSARPDLAAALLKHEVMVVFASGGLEPGSNRAMRRHELFARAREFGVAGTLRQATSVAGELLSRCGKRGPTRAPLGVIQVGAMADLLIVDRNPLEDLHALGAEDARAIGAGRPLDSIRLIMKEGEVLKNTL